MKIGKGNERKMKLEEQLREKNTKELFQACVRQGISIPGWTDEETEEIFMLCWREDLGFDYYLRVVTDWDAGEYDPLEEPDPKDPEAVETYK